MPIIRVTAWTGLGDEKSARLIEGLTRSMHAITGVPVDRITVVIEEIPNSRWGEGGVVGSDLQFMRLSRPPSSL